MIAPRHALARLYSDFYRDQLRRVLRWMLAALIVIFALIATVAYLILFHPAPPYYANTSDGLILAMPAVKQ